MQFKSQTARPGPSKDPYSDDLNPGYQVLEPKALRTPLVFSSPHSGSVYPASFMAATQLDPMSLRRSEDAYVDQLFASALDIGAPIIQAKFPRAFLDVNREPYELDPRMFEERLPSFANTRSMRVAGGLGTIARVVADAREIYAQRLPVAEAIARIEKLYKPWHASLRELLQRAQRMYGRAVLIDCHSMPSTTGRGGRHDEQMRADFVLGDRYGTSCDAALTELIESGLRRRGYRVARNKPYAGGFITEHYGNPAANCHALQIEVNRALYMDERTLIPSPRFDTLAADLASVIRELEDMTWPSAYKAAAE